MFSYGGATVGRLYGVRRYYSSCYSALILAMGLFLAPFALAGTQEAKSTLPGKARLAVFDQRVPGSRVHAVVPANAGSMRVYETTAEGLFASDDGGQSWAQSPIEGANDEVFGLAVNPIDPNVVFAGRRDGLWQTRNGGKLWNPVSSPVAEPYIPLAVAVAETAPGILYVATARHGIFRSSDEGQTWSSASNGLPEARAGGRPEEFRSLIVHPGNPDVAYVAHERHGIYRTTDGGASWRQFGEDIPLAAWQATYVPRLAFNPDDPGQLYAIFAEPIHSHLVKNRLYAISDSGERLPVEATLPDNTAILQLTVDEASRALQLWTQQGVWELPLPGGPR